MLGEGVPDVKIDELHLQFIITRVDITYQYRYTLQDISRVLYKKHNASWMAFKDSVEQKRELDRKGKTAETT